MLADPTRMQTSIAMPLGIVSLAPPVVQVTSATIEMLRSSGGYVMLSVAASCWCQEADCKVDELCRIEHHQNQPESGLKIAFGIVQRSA